MCTGDQLKKAYFNRDSGEMHETSDYNCKISI